MQASFKGSSSLLCRRQGMPIFKNWSCRRHIHRDLGQASCKGSSSLLRRGRGMPLVRKLRPNCRDLGAPVYKGNMSGDGHASRSCRRPDLRTPVQASCKGSLSLLPEMGSREASCEGSLSLLCRRQRRHASTYNRKCQRHIHRDLGTPGHAKKFTFGDTSTGILRPLCRPRAKEVRHSCTGDGTCLYLNKLDARDTFAWISGPQYRPLAKEVCQKTGHAST